MGGFLEEVMHEVGWRVLVGAHPQASGWREAATGVRKGKQGRERLPGRSRGTR